MKTLKAIVMEHGKELLEVFADEMDIDIDDVEITYKLDLMKGEVDVEVYEIKYESVPLDLGD